MMGRVDLHLWLSVVCGPFKIVLIPVRLHALLV